MNWFNYQTMLINEINNLLDKLNYDKSEITQFNKEFENLGDKYIEMKMLYESERDKLKIANQNLLNINEKHDELICRCDDLTAKNKELEKHLINLIEISEKNDGEYVNFKNKINSKLEKCSTILLLSSTYGLQIFATK